MSDNTQPTQPPEPKKSGLKIGISYNSPVILSFAVICTGILLLNYVIPSFTLRFFTVPSKDAGFRFLSLDFYKLFSHAMGHANWGHLVGNFTFILLIGPILEEKYGSLRLILMMFVTALVTGILNVLFFPQGLLGASGIVFMLILLISITNYSSGKIPLTFILIVLLFLGQEVYRAVFDTQNNVSEFAHIIGGICGGVFGFLLAGGKNKTGAATTPPAGTPGAGV